MLSLQRKGRPIAKIVGGDNDGKTLYLNEDAKEIGQEFKLTTGKLQPLPNTKIVEKIYISAPSGAGKSTFAGKWLKEFRRLFPDDEIFLISSIPEDKPLDKNNPIRLDPDELVDVPIEEDDLENSVIIFDDTDTIKDREANKYILGLRDHLLECGRHYKIRMLITSHLISQYKATRRVLNEATSVVLFPKSGGTYQIKQFFKIQAGLEKEQMKKILRLKSRWVLYSATYPQYILYEKGAYLLAEDY
jgi:hypothetical protein